MPIKITFSQFIEKKQNFLAICYDKISLIFSKTFFQRGWIIASLDSIIICIKIKFGRKQKKKFQFKN